MHERTDGRHDREGKIRATNLRSSSGTCSIRSATSWCSASASTRRSASPPALPRRLQRVLPGGRAGHGELRHRVEHVVVVLHGPRQRHLLRDADLSDEPVAVPARQGAVQRAGRAWCRPSITVCSPRRCSACRCAWRFWPLLARRHGRRHGGLVLLLRDLRAADPAQRRVQHGDVDLLLRVPLRQLDVLPARAAAVARSRPAAYANPITWHVDVLRYATIGLGDGRLIVWESIAFIAFTLVVFLVAVRSLEREG